MLQSEGKISPPDEPQTQDKPRTKDQGPPKPSGDGLVEPALWAAWRTRHPSVTAPQRLDVEHPRAHPEWLLFEWSCRAQGVEEVATEALWRALLQGIKLQEVLNARARARRLGPLGAEPGRAAPHNRYFEHVARALGPLLRREVGQGPMALWSRRFELSLHARRLGYATLEATRAGRALGRLEYYRDAGAVVPLWTHLSREFVRQNPEGAAHVFLRGSPGGALFRRRLPVVDLRAPARPTTWHLVSDEELSALRGELGLG